MNDLLTQIMRVGANLEHGLPREQSPELQQQVASYRRNLERLRELLPGVYRALLQEKVRLEAERGRLQAASAWAQSSREIY